jgi:hypothetical protein
MKNYNHHDAYKHYVIKLNNDKRQKIDKLLNQLDQIHTNMIEDAVAVSDLTQANEVINYIKGLK